MTIEGQCHCANISFDFDWPGDDAAIPVRACSCSFCRLHGGVYTSHPAGALAVRIREERDVNRYRFGTGTADFYICTRCGGVPFVTCDLDGITYAVVNVNAFRHVDPTVFHKATTDFDGEDESARLARRRRNWISDVTIDYASRGA